MSRQTMHALIAAALVLPSHVKANQHEPRLVCDTEVGETGRIWAIGMGSRVLFSSDPAHLWISRGSPGSTLRIDVPVSAMSLDSAAELNGQVIFSACTPDAEVIMATDGTQAGTRVLAQIQGDHSSHGIGQMIRCGSLVFFGRGGRWSYGQGLWRTDGTPAGTYPIASGIFGNMLDHDGSLRVCTSIGNGAGALFSSDGTQVVSLLPGIKQAVRSGDASFYLQHSISFQQLWVEEGNQLVRALQIFEYGELLCPGPEVGTIVIRGEVGDVFGLWITNSTMEGTRCFVQGKHGTYLPTSAGNRVFAIKYFDLPTGYDPRLWISDLTEEGSAFIRTNPAGRDNVSILTAAGSRVYFAAVHPTLGRELWSSGGTPETTGVVADIKPGPSSSISTNFSTILPVRNRLYFQAVSGTPGRNFWVLDLCPADFDNSGSVSTDDVLAFVGGYLAGDDLADVNRDGSVGVWDIFTWLADYFGGCET